MHQFGQTRSILLVLRFARTGHAPHPAEIGSRRKVLALAGKNDHAHSAVLAETIDGADEFADQLVVEGVVPIRPVEPEGRDPLGNLSRDLAHRYIRNTPKRVSSIGALRAAARPRPSTRRLSAGATMPSSHSRALA